MIDTLFPTAKQLALIERVNQRKIQETDNYSWPIPKRKWRRGQGNVPKNRAYYQQHREKLIAVAAEWNKLHKERRRQICREYELRKKLGL